MIKVMICIGVCLDYHIGSTMQLVRYLFNYKTVPINFNCNIFVSQCLLQFISQLVW